MRFFAEYLKAGCGCERRQDLLALLSAKGSQASCVKGCSLKGKITLDKLWVNTQKIDYISKLNTEAREKMILWLNSRL